MRASPLLAPGCRPRISLRCRIASSPVQPQPFFDPSHYVVDANSGASPLPDEAVPKFIRERPQSFTEPSIRDTGTLRPGPEWYPAWMPYRRREDNHVFWQDKFSRCSIDVPGAWNVHACTQSGKACTRIHAPCNDEREACADRTHHTHWTLGVRA